MPEETAVTKRKFSITVEVEMEGDLNCKDCPFTPKYDDTYETRVCGAFPEIRFDYNETPRMFRPHTCRAVEIAQND